MRSSISLLTSLICCSSTALAQPIDISPAPPQVVAVACPIGSREEKACLKQVLAMDPRYQAASGRRTGGIVVTSVGSGVGLVAIVAAWTSWMAREVGSTFCSSCSKDYTGEKIAVGAGAGLLVVSLAVGIPMIVSGSREMRFIRNQYLYQVPVPTVSVGPQQASFGASWRF